MDKVVESSNTDYLIVEDNDSTNDIRLNTIGGIFFVLAFLLSLNASEYLSAAIIAAGLLISGSILILTHYIEKYISLIEN